MWLLAIAVLYCALLLPVRLCIVPEIAHGARLRIRMRYAFISAYREFRLITDNGKLQLVSADASGQPHPINTPLSPSVLQQHIITPLLKDGRIRRFLLRHIHMERLTFAVTVHAANAAHTALITSSLRAAVSALPFRWRSGIQFNADFDATCTSLHGECILSFRPGTLFITAGMLLLSLIRQQLLSKRKVNEYGSSYR